MLILALFILFISSLVCCEVGIIYSMFINPSQLDMLGRYWRASIVIMVGLFDLAIILALADLRPLDSPL
jgi:hypothetical protein